MVNYFKLFNIKEAFLINQSELKQQFLLLSKKYHPDFFVNATEDEKEEALQISAAINKGYKILSNSVSTMEYVLELNGIKEKDEKYNLPQDFLMEMMELNEQIMDAKLEQNKDVLSNCLTKIETIKDDIYKPIKTYVETYNENLYSQEGLLQVKDYFFKLKYLERLTQNI
ncbi:MAG: Fe-S protein assembly co-chaperone HscB [Chitinophagaceae bacterium]